MDEDIKTRNSKSRTIIFTALDEKLFARVCRRYPLVPQHRIAQILLRCGLRTIVGDLDRLVEEAKELPGDGSEDLPSPVGVAR